MHAIQFGLKWWSTLGLSTASTPKVCKLPLPNALFTSISDHAYTLCIITALMLNVRSTLHMFVTCWNGSHGDGSCQWLVEVHQLWMKRAQIAKVSWLICKHVIFYKPSNPTNNNLTHHASIVVGLLHLQSQPLLQLWCTTKVLSHMICASHFAESGIVLGGYMHTGGRTGVSWQWQHTHCDLSCAIR